MVGIGPGGPLDRTRRTEEAIGACRVIVGYTLYLKLIADLTEGKELLSSGMTKEKERCRQALQRASLGEQVALISSGDSGVYGMAGLAIELAAAEGISVPIEIIPGVTAAIAAAAKLGAPLMCDYATISMSDLLVPWEIIRSRIEALAAADMTVAIYNPGARSAPVSSKKPRRSSGSTVRAARLSVLPQLWEQRTSRLLFPTSITSLMKKSP